MTVLEVRGLCRSFAGVRAVHDVSFTVERESITSLIGPNGAGKTTVINMVTGVLDPSSGSIFHEGISIAGIGSHRIARRGLRRTFQTVHLFKGLTVLENMTVGRFHDAWRLSPLSAVLPLRLGDKAARADFEAIMERFDLARFAQVVATDLPYGVQRRVEIARALAGQPSLLLLDEPAAGMNDRETERLRDDIDAIRNFGVTVLLVEHDMNLVMSVSDHVVVLDFGEKIAEGRPEVVRADPAVIASYLGA